MMIAVAAAGAAGVMLCSVCGNVVVRVSSLGFLKSKRYTICKLQSESITHQKLINCRVDLMNFTRFLYNVLLVRDCLVIDLSMSTAGDMCHFLLLLLNDLILKTFDGLHEWQGEKFRKLILRFFSSPFTLSAAELS